MTRLDLAGGVAVVTGAASGIGRATALALARRGCALALVDRDADGLRATAEAARGHGVAATEHVLDVAEADAVAALPSAVLAGHGRVTVLVNAAGVALAGRVEEVSMDELRWLMEINFFGVVGLTKAFLPHLQAAGEGQVANLSSLFGLLAPAEQAAYAASKFAVRGWSEALRHELEGTAVGVTVVHPGGVATAISRSARIAAGADTAGVARKQAAFERQFLRTPPEAVGEAIADAIERRKPRLLVASGARAGAALQRLMPARYWRVLRRGFERLSGA
jgi:short-subunit dehydrogenase